MAESIGPEYPGAAIHQGLVRCSLYNLLTDALWVIRDLQNLEFPPPGYFLQSYYFKQSWTGEVAHHPHGARSLVMGKTCSWCLHKFSQIRPIKCCKSLQSPKIYHRGRCLEAHGRKGSIASSYFYSIERCWTSSLHKKSHISIQRGK